MRRVANGVDSNQILCSAGSDLDLHCMFRAIGSSAQVRSIMILFVAFLCSDFTQLRPLHCFIIVFMSICVSLRCLTDETKNPYVEQT